MVSLFILLAVYINLIESFDHDYSSVVRDAKTQQKNVTMWLLFFYKDQFIFGLGLFMDSIINKKNTPALPALSLNLKNKATYQELDCNLLLIS